MTPTLVSMARIVQQLAAELGSAQALDCETHVWNVLGPGCSTSQQYTKLTIVMFRQIDPEHGHLVNDGLTAFERFRSCSAQARDVSGMAIA